MSSCENPRHSTYVMAPFSRAPLKLTIALFVAALSWVWRSCRSFFPRCAWRARESFDWTRSTTPTHTPPTPRLVWLSSISLSGWVTNGSSHCSRCPAPPPPRPPLSPLPLSLPSPPPPPVLLLPLRLVEFLSLSLEGPLPPLGQPMNCPLRPLFGFSSLRCVCVYMCVYVVISFILDVGLVVDAPDEVTQEEGHKRFSHLPSARRIQPSLSLDDHEVEFCVPTNYLLLTCWA